jgi:hypothetical protein
MQSDRLLRNLRSLANKAVANIAHAIRKKTSVL